MNVCNSPRRVVEVCSAFVYFTSVKCCGCTKTTVIRAAGPEGVATSVQADPTLTALSRRVSRRMSGFIALSLLYYRLHFCIATYEVVIAVRQGHHGGMMVR